MTRWWGSLASGEEHDNDMGTNSFGGVNTVTCETTFVVADAHSVATRILKFPTNTATSAARISPGVGDINDPSNNGLLVDGIFVWQGYVGTSATPSAAIGLVTDGAASSTQRYIRINTSRQIEVCGKAGTLFAKSTSLVANSGSGATEFMVMIDTLTNTSNVRVAIWMNRRLESLTDTGITRTGFFDTATGWYWGENNSASSKGADFYLTHGLHTFCDAASDTPLLNPWPSVYVINPGPPTGDTLAEWTSGTGTTFAEVDDAGSPGSVPGNDGATTFLQSLVNDQKYLATYSTANVLDATDTIYAVFVGSTGALVSGGKVCYHMMLRMGGVDVKPFNPTLSSTAYRGWERPIARPGGGSWVSADFAAGNISFGARTSTVDETGGTAVGSKMTNLAMLVVYQHQGDWFDVQASSLSGPRAQVI